MSFIRALTTLDEFTLNLGPSAKDIQTAMAHGDKLGAVQHSIEHASGHIAGTRYAATGIDKGTTLAVLASKYFHLSVDSKLVSLLDGITPTQVLAGLGIILGTFTIIINSISIYRQQEVLSAIKEENTLEQNLDSLNQINYNHFRKALPTHLQTRLEEYGGKEALTHLKEDVKEGYTTRAKNFVDDVKHYAQKKQIVHILGVIGGIVSLIGAIGVLVGFPPLALILIAVAGLALTIACVLMSNGWVENPKDGFNWRLCLPEFMQKKLDIDKEHVLEMDAMTSVHDEISPHLHMMEMGSVVDDNDIIDFNKPLVEPEIPKAPTRWEKFKALFHPKKELSVEPRVAQQGVPRTGAHGSHKFRDSFPLRPG